MASTTAASSPTRLGITPSRLRPDITSSCSARSPCSLRWLPVRLGGTRRRGRPRSTRCCWSVLRARDSPPAPRPPAMTAAASCSARRCSQTPTPVTLFGRAARRRRRPRSACCCWSCLGNAFRLRRDKTPAWGWPSWRWFRLGAGALEGGGGCMRRRGTGALLAAAVLSQRELFARLLLDPREARAARWRLRMPQRRFFRPRRRSPGARAAARTGQPVPDGAASTSAAAGGRRRRDKTPA